MEQTLTDTRGTVTGFGKRLGAALSALRRETGCSLQDSPMPEIRAVAQELSRDWHGAPPAGTAQLYRP